jgi:hypothetical protein
MLVFLKSVAYGAVVGIAAGLVIAAAGFVRSYSRAGVGDDEHGYATLAAVLICGILGGMFGVAAGVGAYLKQKAEGAGE